ncbi:MAG: hypothetical protein H7250_08955 [Flavobacterium sp.]|nr:hypothetical protein [Flavobacterium sp.]
MKYSLIILFVIIIGCKPQNEIPIFEIRKVKCNKPLLLTSYYDSQILYLWIPFEFEIKNNIKDTIDLNPVVINECDSTKKYLPPFISDSSNIDNNYAFLKTKIYPKGKKRFIFYASYGFFPFGDSLRRKIKKDNLLEEQYQLIKKNCTKNNNFKNDTIKYTSLSDFKNKHQKAFNVKIKGKCEEVNIFLWYYDKKLNKINEMSDSFTITY